MKIINFGSLNIDYVYQVDRFVQPGETKMVKARQAYCGGKGLNQSVALARAGLETWHAGFIGSDGGFLVDRLRESGVHTELLCSTRQDTGHAIIQVNESGQNCILICPGTNVLFTEDYVEEVLSHFGPGDVVLLQNETNLVGEIMERSAAHGLLIAFNAAPMDEKVRNYPLEKVRWLFVNELEGVQLSGERQYTTAIRALRERYPSTEIIMTLGSEGSMYLGDGGVLTQRAYPVSPVDTTGAGDTFTGYFLRGALQQVAALSPLELASRAGAIAVGRMGASDSIPTLMEVLSLSGESGAF